MFELTGTVEGFMLWVNSHQSIAYWIFFGGAYIETLIGPSLFIPGEPFFLSGAILAGAGALNIFLVTIYLYAGAILGDSSSYFIGRKTSVSIFKEGNRVFSAVNYRKGEEFFKKFGYKAIFLARILGPMSWITPFLAGIYGVPYKVFLTYNIPGILVGVGQFIVIGYFFGSQYKTIVKYYGYFVLLTVALYIGYLIWKHFHQKNKMINSEKESV